MKFALLLCSVLSLATLASAKVTEKFTQTYPLDATGAIRLENVNGSVEITAWDQAEIALEAEKTARTTEGLAGLQLKIESTPGRFQVKTEYVKKWKFWDNMNAQVHYKLRVPAGARIEKIDVVNASILVTGMKGAVSLGSVNGRVEAEGLAGAGKFETVNGSIRVTYATMPPAGGIALETVNGNCTLALPDRSAFEFDAETVNGRISCDFPLTISESTRHQLRGTVSGGGPKVTLESVNGNLTVNQAK